MKRAFYPVSFTWLEETHRANNVPKSNMVDRLHTLHHLLRSRKSSSVTPHVTHKHDFAGFLPGFFQGLGFIMGDHHWLFDEDVFARLEALYSVLCLTVSESSTRVPYVVFRRREDHDDVDLGALVQHLVTEQGLAPKSGVKPTLSETSWAHDTSPNSV